MIGLDTTKENGKQHVYLPVQPMLSVVNLYPFSQEHTGCSFTILQIFAHFTSGNRVQGSLTEKKIDLCLLMGTVGY